MNTDAQRVNAITETLIGCAFCVSKLLGCGFLEKPYENVLAHALKKEGLQVQQQVPICVHLCPSVVNLSFD